jgi:hypothetical protein
VARRELTRGACWAGVSDARIEAAEAAAAGIPHKKQKVGDKRKRNKTRTKCEDCKVSHTRHCHFHSPLVYSVCDPPSTTHSKLRNWERLSE